MITDRIGPAPSEDTVQQLRVTNIKKPLRQTAAPVSRAPVEEELEMKPLVSRISRLEAWQHEYDQEV